MTAQTYNDINSHHTAVALAAISLAPYFSLVILDHFWTDNMSIDHTTLFLIVNWLKGEHPKSNPDLTLLGPWNRTCCNTPHTN